MSLPSFLKFGSSAKHALIFDIASSSVGVVVITHHHKKSTPPKILYTSRASIRFDGGEDAQALASALTSALASITEDAHKALSMMYKTVKPFDVHAILHAPWAESTSKNASRTFDQPLKVSKDLIENLIHDSFPDINKGNPNLLAAHISKVALNGYHVREPIGNIAQNLSVTLLVSSAHQTIKESIINTISSAFTERRLYFDTFVHAAYGLAESLGTTHKQYVLADIGGEYTDLTIIRDGTLKTKTSVDFGSNYLLRAIAEKTGVPLEAAKSKFIMLDENTCTPTECRNIRSALVQTESQWTKNFGEACATLSKESRVPDTLFLSSSLFAYKWFANNISRIDFAQFTSTLKPFAITPLIDEGNVDAYYASTSIPRDTRLLLISLFVDKCKTGGTYDKLFVI